MKKTLVAFLSWALVAALSGGIAVAQTEISENDSTRPPIRLQISPTSRHYTLRPGMTLDDSLTVVNSGTQPFSYTVYVSSFTVTNENYELDYNDIINPNTQLASWITLGSSSGQLAAGARGTVDFTVEVPTDLPEGSQYAVIFVETSSTPAGENPGAVQAVQRLGMMMYADFHGRERFEGQLVENSIPWWWWHGPVTGRAVVENTGNTHFYAYYDLQVKSWWADFGRGTVSDEGWEQVDASNYLIMPATRRLVMPGWTDPPAVGIYRVRQNVSFLAENSVNEEVVVILSPILVISVAVFVSLGVIWFSWYYWRDERKSKKSRHKGEREK
jgi:hypothetical protein